MSSQLEVKHIPWLYAAGDSTQVIVWRSLAVDPADRRMAEIKDHLDEHGMVLMEREVLKKDSVIFGRVEKSYYVNAEVRHLLMLDASGALDDGGQE